MPSVNPVGDRWVKNSAPQPVKIAQNFFYAILSKFWEEI